jgi:acyl carrier protein
MSINIRDINAALERCLELPVGTINGHETLTDLQWDSMSAIIFMAMADEQFGVKVSPEQLSGAKTIHDLHALVIRS